MTHEKSDAEDERKGDVLYRGKGRRRMREVEGKARNEGGREGG